MSPSNANCSLLICFFVLFDTDAFKARFNFLELPVKGCWEVVEKATFPAAKEIMKQVEFKFPRRNSTLKNYQFLFGKTLTLCELGTV